MLSAERKIYAVCLVGVVVTALTAVYLLMYLWSIEAPVSLFVAVILTVIGLALTAFIAWRALRGIRPRSDGPLMVAMKLLSMCILLALFAPRLWAALRK